MSQNHLAEVKIAAKLAASLTSGAPIESSYLTEDLKRSVDSIVREVEPLVIEETGFEVSTPSRAKVLTRGEWASSNVDSMLVLMQPMIEMAEQRMKRNPVSGLARFAYRPIMGAQLGGVLGILSRRVLGQYDLISEDDDVIWIVGANLLSMERRLGFVPEDFRKWVIIHELTHRAQFSGNPWLKDHFMDSVRNLLGSISIDAKAFVNELRKSTVEKGAPLTLRMMPPKQRERFLDLQAFMSLLEGHANFVMSTVGERVIPTKGMITSTFTPGASSLPLGPLTKLINRLLGLEMKRKQYSEGQKFLEMVAAKGGRQAVAACFASPSNLPTLDEIRDPESWLQRHAA